MAFELLVPHMADKEMGDAVCSAGPETPCLAGLLCVTKGSGLWVAAALEASVTACAHDSPELWYCSVGNIHFLLKLFSGKRDFTK